MDFKILSRRAVSLFLCLCLVSFSAIPRAEATGAEEVASITIAAGGLSTGGLSGSALVSAVAPYVVPVVAIALAGFGINAYVTEQSKHAGMTRSDYVKDTIDKYCSAASYNAVKFYSTIAKGITIGPTGKIQLSHEASKAISQMIEWMFTQDGMIVDTPVSGGGNYDFVSGFIGNYPCFILNPGTSLIWTMVDSNGNPSSFSLKLSNSSSPVYCCLYNYAPDGTNFYGLGVAVISSSSFLLQYSFRNNSFSTLFTYDREEYFFARDSWYSYPNTAQSFNPNCPVYVGEPSSLASDFITSGFQTDATSVPGQDCFTGDDANYLENKDVLNPTIDNVVTTLNPDVLNKILDSLGSVATDYTMSIADYLDALTKAYDQALEDVKTGLATLTDVVTGIKEQIAIPDTAAADPSIAAEDTGNYDPAIDDTEPDVPEVSEQFQYPLKNLFPFCIPFDLFALYSVFDAEPVAPRVEINYTFPIGNGIPIHVVLDLAPWSSVAATLRAMVLVAFVAGLAVRTRRIFIQA